MPDHGRPRRSPARLLAPVALLLVAGAVGYVVTSSLRTEDAGGGDSVNRSSEPRQRQDGRQQRRGVQRTFYRVRLNDTLGSIAEQTGVPIERIEELNPELDPQNLIVGQRIRLRE